MPCLHEDGSESPYCMQCDRDAQQGEIARLTEAFKCEEAALTTTGEYAAQHLQRADALEAEAQTRQQAIARLVAKWRADAAELRRRRDLRDDVYDDRAMDMLADAKKLEQRADELATLTSGAR
ncbi:MAG: hypothetical protein GEV06_28465 [Luteitalea sp.]|nr:hypothetical protein [Luteitalea sp.]